MFEVNRIVLSFSRWLLGLDTITMFGLAAEVWPKDYLSLGVCTVYFWLYSDCFRTSAVGFLFAATDLRTCRWGLSASEYSWV